MLLNEYCLTHVLSVIDGFMATKWQALDLGTMEVNYEAVEVVIFISTYPSLGRTLKKIRGSVPEVSILSMTMVITDPTLASEAPLTIYLARKYLAPALRWAMTLSNTWFKVHENDKSA